MVSRQYRQPQAREMSLGAYVCTTILDVFIYCAYIKSIGSQIRWCQERRVISLRKANDREVRRYASEI